MQIHQKGIVSLSSKATTTLNIIIRSKVHCFSTQLPLSWGEPSAQYCQTVSDVHIGKWQQQSQWLGSKKTNPQAVYAIQCLADSISMSFFIWTAILRLTRWISISIHIDCSCGHRLYDWTKMNWTNTDIHDGEQSPETLVQIALHMHRNIVSTVVLFACSSSISIASTDDESLGSLFSTVCW